MNSIPFILAIIAVLSSATALVMLYRDRKRAELKRDLAQGLQRYISKMEAPLPWPDPPNEPSEVEKAVGASTDLERAHKANRLLSEMAETDRRIDQLQELGRNIPPAKKPSEIKVHREPCKHCGSTDETVCNYSGHGCPENEEEQQ